MVKYVINKFNQPTFDQKVLLAACEPVLERDRRPSWDQCKLPEFKESMTQKDSHPYEVILAKELQDEITNSDFIAFYHKNSILGEAEKKIKNTLTKKGFLYRHKNRRIYKLATETTKFSSLTNFLYEVPNTVLVMSDKSSGRQINQRAKELLTIDKKMFGYVLMFAFAEDRILRKDELIELSQIPSLDHVRGQVCSTLNHALSTISHNLSHHQTMLSMSLDQLSKHSEKTEE